MKWLGSSKKQAFVNWVDDATKEELKEYAIDKKYPTGWKLVTECLLIVFLTALMCGSVAFGALQYMDNVRLEHKYQNNPDTIMNLGKQICTDSDMGKYVHIWYGKEMVILSCEKGTLNYLWED